MAPPTACLLLILALAPQDVIPRLTLDLPIQGVIAEGDRVIRTDALSELSAKPVLGRAFELQLDEPGTVTIQLSSSLFDGYLVLRDDEGRVIVEDDDGWIGTRPQLVAKELDHGQLYSVEVGALHGREGHFELVVRRGEPEPIGDEAMAALEVDLTERAMRAAERYYGPDSDELARAIYALGDVYWYRGEYERVQPYYERALEVRTRALGAGHLETGLYVNDLGWLHYLTGRYEKAEECLERAIGIYEGVPESERLQPRYAELLGRTLTNLGEVAMRTGRHEDARDVLEWALEVHEQGLGEDDRRTLYTRKQLGLALQGLDDFAGALAVWERSLELLEAKLGPDHTEAFDVRYDLIGLLNYFVVDSEAAGNLARRNLELARQHLGPDDVHLARALYSLGLVEQSMRRNPESLELYSEAVEVATRAVGADDPETVSYLGYVGTAHKNLGDFAAARPLLEAHLDAQLRIRGPDARETGFAHLYLGDLAALEGRYRDAVGHHRDALASLRRTLGPRDLYLANPLLGIAESLDRLGETSEARAAAEECIDLLLDSLGPGHPRLLQVQEVLARVLQDVSDLAGARAVLQDAVAAAEVRLGEHHPDFATVLLAFGMLLARMGDFDEADEVLERGLLIRESIFGVEHVRYADALRMRVATARFREDWPAMIEGMERALDGIESALGAAHPSTASIRYEYGRALSERGDLERSREVLARSLADLEAALGPESHKAQEVAVFLAHVDSRLGEHEAALDRLRRTRDQAIETFGDGHHSSTNARIELAIALIDAGGLLEAEAELDREAKARAARIQRRLATLETGDRFRYLSSCLKFLELRISVARELKDNEATARAYDEVLRWKGRVARLLGASREQLQRGASDEESRLLDELRSCHARLSRAALATDVVDAEAHRARLVALAQERSRLERALAASTASGGLQFDVASFARLRDGLPPDSALVDFLVHRLYRRASGFSEQRVTAWVSRPGAEAPVEVDLGPAVDVESAIRAFLEGLAAQRGIEAASAPRNEAGARVHDLLWAPLAASLEGSSTIFVSPDGVLGTLPFEVLPIADGTRAVEQLAFVYLQDAVAATTGEPGEADFGSLLSVGGVDFRRRDAPESKVEESTPSLSIDSKMRGSFTDYWGRLPATAYESQVVADLHEDAFAEDAARRLLQNGSPSEERLKRELPQHAVLHLATHGFFQPEGTPSLWAAARGSTQERGALGEGTSTRLAGRLPGLLSGLVCAGANRSADLTGDDGYLTADEVSWLDLSRCEMVVLSACETGLGRPQSGEGLLGLRRAFQSAGARTVVSSLWSVKDESTADLMRDFYKNLWLKEMDRHEALRAAQLAMLRRNRAEHGKDVPSTWGAFVLSGEGR